MPKTSYPHPREEPEEKQSTFICAEAFFLSTNLMPNHGKAWGNARTAAVTNGGWVGTHTAKKFLCGECTNAPTFNQMPIIPPAVIRGEISPERMVVSEAAGLQTDRAGVNRPPLASSRRREEGRSEA